MTVCGRSPLKATAADRLADADLSKRWSSTRSQRLRVGTTEESREVDFFGAARSYAKRAENPMAAKFEIYNVKNALDASRFEKKTSTNGSPYFVLKAGNHEVIGTSEMYSSTSARDGGIEAVQRAAADAAIVDET